MIAPFLEPASSSTAPTLVAPTDGGHDKTASGDSSAVLGRNTLKHIHTWLPLTELPSWVDRVPANVGT